MLSIDLSQNWTNAAVELQSTVKPSGFPALNNLPSSIMKQKTFTPDSQDTIQVLAVSFFIHYHSSLFKPDGTRSGAWDQVIGPDSSIWEPLTRPAASLMANSPNAALISGGDRDYDEPISPQTLLSGLVQFDMKSQSFANHSAQCCNATGGEVSCNMFRLSGQRDCLSPWEG